MTASAFILPGPPAPGVSLHPHTWDLLDQDAQHPQYTSRPTVEIELYNSLGARTYVHTLHTPDSLVRTNSFQQRSQTCSIILHDVSDWIHAAGVRSLHSMQRIVVKEGYWGHNIPVFDGYIVVPDYSHYPFEVRLSCADALYLLKSFFVLSPLDYSNWYAEDAVRDILARSGIPSSLVNINGDGSKSLNVGTLPGPDDTVGRHGAIWSYQSGESILGHILDTYGYRYWCDTSGMIEVQYVRMFPEAAPTPVPAYNGLAGQSQQQIRYMAAYDAQSVYGNPALPGNLLQVVSYSRSVDDLRNFVGVYNGIDPPVYEKAAPNLPQGGGAFPPPVLPFISSGSAAAYAASHNADLVSIGYYTKAAIVASDLIAGPSFPAGNSVGIDYITGLPTVAAGYPMDMRTWIAKRVLHDLNRESEQIAILVPGNPMLDIGQTMEVRESAKTRVSSLFLITGYETRMSGTGYTTQIKGVGGPPLADTRGPRPRLHARSIKTKSGATLTGISSILSYTGDGTTAWTPSFT